MSLALLTPARREAWRFRLRSRIFTAAANWRLARVDRLIEAGRGSEARRVMAAIGRDVRRQHARLDRR